MSKILLATTMLAVLAACGDDAPLDPTDRAAVASVEVWSTATALDVGETLQMTATPLDEAGEELEGRAIVWTSSDPDVATISATGLVTAHAGGPVVISATSEGVTGQAPLTVRTVDAVPVAWLEITAADDIVLAPGETAQLVAIPHAADGSALDGRLVTWTSAHTGVATVSADGVVTALSEGGVWITATCEGQEDEVLLGVEEPEAPVAWIEITAGDTLALDTGHTAQLEVIAHAADGSVLGGHFVGWWSAAPTVATVNDFGVVTAHAKGTATIWANVEGKTAQIAVKVETAVEWVELSHTEAVIVVNGALQLEAWPRAADGAVIDREVTWESDHPELVSVSPSGTLYGVAEGGAIITATSGGKSASLVVYTTVWQTHDLLTVGGAALPAQLYSYTEVDENGVEATLTFVAHAGQLRWHGITPRYELRVFGWLYVDGEFAMTATYLSEGSWTAGNGQFVFQPDLGDAFPGTVNPDFTMSVLWQADEAAPAATLLFSSN